MNEESPKCLYGGALVGTKFPLPDDQKIYYKDKDKLIGCNRLYCSNCKSFVKNWAGYKINKEAVAAEKNKFAGTGSQLKNNEDIGSIYNTKNPEKQPLFTKNGDYRVYSCNCSFFEIQSVYELSLGDWADVDTWACAGHSQK
ncbi:hypothetical protein J4450_05645 [Candidatus Micrarchaeota archaeon]|nr:hypothetical protein [Candidatus Micrarchaeota archaeon]